jgi:hypothetical protein
MVVFGLSLPGLVMLASASLATSVPAALFTLAVMLMLELAVEPRVFNRKRYNSLLIAVVAVGLAEVVGVVGLVLGPPLAAIVQILSRHWLRHRGVADACDGAPSLPKIREQLSQLQAQVNGLESPSPELVSFVDRLSDLAHDAETAIGERASARLRNSGFQA